MEFDCKGTHHKCRAVCCSAIPIPRKIWEDNQDKVITKPTEAVDFPDDYIFPKTESGGCPFLRNDYHCNIYENRPDVCRKFGDESTILMSCPYLHNNGKERSRQSFRHLQRQLEKSQNLIQLRPNMFKARYGILRLRFPLQDFHLIEICAG